MPYHCLYPFGVVAVKETCKFYLGMCYYNECLLLYRNESKTSSRLLRKIYHTLPNKKNIITLNAILLHCAKILLKVGVTTFFDKVWPRKITKNNISVLELTLLNVIII